MLGISLAYLPGKNIQEVCDTFFSLQADFALEACELHMESNQFPSAFYQVDDQLLKAISKIRSRVKIMGIHLPYLDLNPISNNPHIAQFATNTYKQAIHSAASLQADYVVFHARSSQVVLGDRQIELQQWQKIVSELGEYAHLIGIAFCFENADDIRLMDEVEKVICENRQVNLCLDIGHLFERIKLENPWEWLSGKISDRYLPLSASFKKGLPFYEIPIWSDFLIKYSDRIKCVHLHNHNGRIAHDPVTGGKINMDKMLHSFKQLASVPVIIEADYRRIGIERLRNDLAFIREVME